MAKTRLGILPLRLRASATFSGTGRLRNAVFYFSNFLMPISIARRRDPESRGAAICYAGRARPYRAPGPSGLAGEGGGDTLIGNSGDITFYSKIPTTWFSRPPGDGIKTAVAYTWYRLRRTFRILRRRAISITPSATTCQFDHRHRRPVGSMAEPATTFWLARRDGRRLKFAPVKAATYLWLAHRRPHPPCRHIAYQLFADQSR